MAFFLVSFLIQYSIKKNEKASTKRLKISTIIRFFRKGRGIGARARQLFLVFLKRMCYTLKNNERKIIPEKGAWI
jgi:hypothetical protein